MNRFRSAVEAFPPFRPLPLLGGPHTQTIGATYLTRCPSLPNTVQHYIDLSDGDQLVVHDNRPPNWQVLDPVVLLIHGLSGCHGSSYMVRAAAKLVSIGVRTFRLDMRGCGAGVRLSKHSMHAGRGDDVQTAIRFVASLAPQSPRSAVGFSLGGLILLRAIADHNDIGNHSLACAMAISPPIDLQVCSGCLCLPRNRAYDRTMSRWLYRYVVNRRDLNPAIAAKDTSGCPRSIRDFDKRFTAPLGGFDSVDDYYASASVTSKLDQIRIPTLIVATQDDPLIPFSMFARAIFSESTLLYSTDCGGHVGFLGRRGTDPDRWWLDWRIADWILAGCKRNKDTSR